MIITIGTMPGYDKDTLKEDKERFEKHSERSYRFRHATSNETDCLSDGRPLDGLVIYQVVSSCRIRYPVIFSELTGLNLNADFTMLAYDGDEPEINNTVEKMLGQIFQRMKEIVLNIPKTVEVSGGCQ